MRMLNINTASVYMPYLMRLSCSFKYASTIANADYINQNN